MTENAIEARRLVGKVVLVLALCWVIALIAVVAAALRGPSFEPFTVVLAILPGCAFVPGSYNAARLHTTVDPEQLTILWRKAFVYGVAGLVLVIGGAYSVYAMGEA